jgi:hypothetical protein
MSESEEKVTAVCPKAAGSFVVIKERPSEIISACMTSSYSDCYRDFERRSCGDLHEGAGSGERSAEKPSSTQINQESVGIESLLTVMNSSRNLGAPTFADEDAGALAIFASANLPSILPMGAFPLTLVALGHVSRRSLDGTVK